MRIGLPGSNSFAGGLSNLSQSGHPRSRSGTGSWSGGDRAASAASAGWPRGFARGGGGGGVGVSGSHTPPRATSTSWTKLSVATLAAQRFSSSANQEPFSPSAPQQPSAAEIFGGAGGGGCGAAAAAGLADDAAAGSGAPKLGQGEKEEKGGGNETYSPLTLRSAYRGADDGGLDSALGCGRPAADRRWEDGEVPFREKYRGALEEGEGGNRGAGSVPPEGRRQALHEAVTGTRESAPRLATPAVEFGGVQPAPEAARSPSAAVEARQVKCGQATASKNQKRKSSRSGGPYRDPPRDLNTSVIYACMTR